MQQRQRAEPDRPVQTKLVVGPADDRYEREADRVAKQVVGSISAGASLGVAEPTRRQSIEDEELLQGKRVAEVRRAPALPGIGPEGGDVAPETTARIEGARGGGRPLEPGVRRSMEGAFGADFSAVRIHQGASSDRLNSELNARAFTTGPDVFLRSGEYRPASTSGSELLAHELTHVVQQGAAPTLDDT